MSPTTPRPLRLVLARHGQTPANVERVLDTRLPGPGLTELGREQARALGRELALEGPVDGLYHSAAARAVETAGLVGDGVGRPADLLEGIHEVQVGDLEGRNDEAGVGAFRDVLDAWLGGDLDRAFPAGESARDVLERFSDALGTVRERHPDGGRVVLVSHGAALRLVGAVLIGGPTDAARAARDGAARPDTDENHLGNCGRIVTRLDPAADAGWTLEEWRTESPAGPSSHDVTG